MGSRAAPRTSPWSELLFCGFFMLACGGRSHHVGVESSVAGAEQGGGAGASAAGGAGPAGAGFAGNPTAGMTSKVCDWDCYPGYSGSESCGDGALGPGEACDDGNTLSGDGCSGDCKTVESGYVCPGAGECVRVPACGSGCGVAGAIVYGLGCTADCERAPYCGDGVVESEYGEQCDMGAPAASPYGGCTFECKLGPYCGDGVVDVPFGENCDDGAANGTEGDPCSSVCHPVVN